MSGSTISSVVGGVFGGGGGSSSAQTSGSSSGPSFQQMLLTYKGASPYDVHLVAGENQSPHSASPDVTSHRAEAAKVATKWSITNTPTQGAEDEVSQAKQDSGNYWADRLSKYLDYNSRQLG